VEDGANVGFNCEIFSASSVRVGADTLIAAYCYLIGGEHDFSDPSQPVLAQARRSTGVTIGAGAWLGAGAKILDGVSVGDRAVIGAGAVVREAVPSGSVAVGVPARVIGQRASARGEPAAAAPGLEQR
jgi:acetyltransferase-like isoleucine patch superfamily enzyme